MKILASLTAALVLAAAGSASAQEARIAWGDLNLSTPAGAEAFDARVDAASRKMCRTARRTGSHLSDRAFCRAAVQSEALRQLPDTARTEYALSRTPLTV
jgi:UrcA family protein